ncbi:hypothetical protein PC2016_0088 [Pseudoalteromonas carrageenovora]|uniref:Type IV pilus biogenesis protein PilP n=1 Tax=Pseudoalteromonas carrageenovora IAM 12662 TaxID=1314868 RepID=A0A2K4X4Y1_PSEVC|nr:hypothetical protein [Pseudoalteromonas carrageenovora]MBE0381478.1 hypothetical protein [Pseudoalteromonas carrageenovora IAM 12662]MDO6548833.1 hypothetical protein [Pseudoalteromonas carrageenovora]MDO6833281.1 hypothetical protein [Pseudoalteromonas carrageenovora]QBJ70339.1 hypothetical protein PC2016_0088 [Pseudoalteromonas carrageenovora]SOU39394.1 conserved exported protein of unknown function [Pseudoalteromonas carrageenovora IAM 12662]
MKKQLLSLLVLLSAPTVTAQEINVQALQACSFIENDFNRLLCYDNTVAGKPLTKPSEKKTLTPPKPVANITPNVSAPVAAVTASAPAAKDDDFGLEHKEITKDKDENITALVSSVKKAPYGELIISLDNSQEWRQIGSDSLKLKKSDTVVISRGVFNSFLLRKDGQNRSIRVKRTQ